MSEYWAEPQLRLAMTENESPMNLGAPMLRDHLR